MESFRLILFTLFCMLNACASLNCTDNNGEPIPTDSPQCALNQTSNSSAMAASVEPEDKLFNFTLDSSVDAVFLERNVTFWAEELYRSGKESGSVERNKNVVLRYLKFQPDQVFNHSTTVAFDSNKNKGDEKTVAENVEILPSTLRNLTSNGKSAVLIVASVEQKTKITQTPGNDAISQILASNIISVSAFNPVSSGFNRLRKVSIPITYSVRRSGEPLIDSLNEQGRTVVYSSTAISCTYYDGSLSRWSTFGCSPVAFSGGLQTCRCNHTSSFAVVLSVRSFQVPPGLSVTANVAEVISVVSLLCTTAMLVLIRRHIPVGRFLTQFGMSLSLLLLHGAFLLASLALTARLEGLCSFTAVAAHLFTLTAAMWMLNEGVMLFLKTRRNSLKFDPDAHSRKLILSGWIFPMVYVSVCALGGFLSNNYMAKVALEPGLSPPFVYSSCWLAATQVLLLAIPLGLIFSTNAAIVAVLMWKVRKLNRDTRKLVPSDLKPKRRNTLDKGSNLQVTAHAMLILLPILGVPWLLALLVNIPGAELFFVALHVTINGLQGLLFSIVVVFKNHQVRSTARRRLTKVGMDFSRTLEFS